MQRRKLGANGPEVGAIGLGCMGMSDFYGPADRAESIATIHAALDSGATLIDTGDFYGSGHNELLIAEALRGRRREDYVLSVKFGALRDPAGGFIGYDARPEATKNFLAYTLKRLGVDRDRHLSAGAARSRRSDRGYDRRDRRHGQGRLRARDRALRGRRSDHPPRRGGSPDRRSADRIFARHAHDRRAKSCRPAARSASGSRPTACWRAASSPAIGRRRGRMRPISGASRRASLATISTTISRWSRLCAKSAHARGVSVAATAVAWVLAQGREIVPLVGARKRGQWAESSAADAIRLSAADLAAIEQAIPKGAAKGERYPAQAMAHLDSEKRG